MKLVFEKIELRFLFPAGTSRGVLSEKSSWILRIKDNPKIASECSVIPGLNPDFTSVEAYEKKVKWVCDTFNLLFGKLDERKLLQFFCQELKSHSSILFGVESLFYQLDLSRGVDVFESPFSRGEASIPINGLIWMGSIHEMRSRVKEKIEQGFSILKFKIGALDFEKEYALLKEVRKEFGSKIEIRVDANGAFDASNVKMVLEKLSILGIHSIEQPIRPGNKLVMKELCHSSPVPIALDEELIGINELSDKSILLKEVCPQYIILKPSLHGGIKGTLEWISVAEQLNIGWWMTSALESSIGLEMLARIAGYMNPIIPQGLGTGGLFENNFESALLIKEGTIKFRNV